MGMFGEDRYRRILRKKISRRRSLVGANLSEVFRRISDGEPTPDDGTDSHGLSCFR